MNLPPTIEVAFQYEAFQVHKIKTEDKVYHRLNVPSVVAVVLHDPINDKLFMRNQRDLTTFGDALVIPEFTPVDGESNYVAINRELSGIGVDAKSIGYVQTVAVDPKNSGKQVTIMYVQVDSRSVPKEAFVESTGTTLVKLLGSQDCTSSINIIAANYLRLKRKSNGLSNKKD